MDALANTLSYSEYKDVEDLEISYEMWEKHKIVYGGDKHVQKAKDESLRGKLDDTRMQGENIKTYGKWVKYVILAIIFVGGILHEEDVVIKTLRTFLHKYAISVSSI